VIKLIAALINIIFWKYILDFNILDGYSILIFGILISIFIDRKLNKILNLPGIEY
jgi:hypothetical protein